MFKPSQLLTLLLLFLAGAATAQDTAQVQRYFAGLNSLQANFQQTVFDDRSRVLQTSSGRMYMKKPGRFHWDYQAPLKQVIVADGERLWLYDRDLAQVTVRKLEKALTATPLALLSGAAPLEKEFTVKDAGVEGGLHWYELKPREEQAEFKLLRVAFQDQALSIIELEDSFNQRTRLRFFELQPNAAIDPQLLQFVPPPGVDVVGDAP